MIPRVKICGVTSVEDALMAVEAGADAIGLMFYEASPRFVTYEQARDISDALPPFVARVGVFVDSSVEFVRAAVAIASLNTVQFHGSENAEFCASFPGRRSLKAFRIQDESSLELLKDFPKVGAWLLDSYVKGVPGGTGEVFNWDLAVKAKSMGRPIILAGGLNPDNVVDAVAKVQPYGLDVSSGVESAPGKKDPEKLKAFIARAKGYNL